MSSDFRYYHRILRVAASSNKRFNKRFKRLIALLQLVLKFTPMPAWVKPRPPILCPCCGAAMVIVKTGLRARFDGPLAVPRTVGGVC